jgi:hypothetical protein
MAVPPCDQRNGGPCPSVADVNIGSGWSFHRSCADGRTVPVDANRAPMAQTLGSRLPDDVPGAVLLVVASDITWRLVLVIEIKRPALISPLASTIDALDYS